MSIGAGLSSPDLQGSSLDEALRAPVCLVFEAIRNLGCIPIGVEDRAVLMWLHIREILKHYGADTAWDPLISIRG